MNQKRPPSAKKFIRKQKSADTGEVKRGLKVKKSGNQSSSVRDTKTGGLKIKGASNKTGSLKIKKAGQDSQVPGTQTSGLKIKSASNKTGSLKIKKAGQDSQIPGTKTTGLKIKSASNQTNATGLSIKKGKTASHILRRKKSGNETATPDGLNVKRPGGKTQGVGLKVSGRKAKDQIEKIQANVLNNTSDTKVTSDTPAENFKLKSSGNNTLNEQAFHAHTPSNGLFGNIKAAVKKEEAPAKPLKKAAPVLDPLLSSPDALAEASQAEVTPEEPAPTPAPAPTPEAPSSTGENEYADMQGTPFCLIPAGNYVVGTDNRPHEVTIPFGISKFQITKEQFFHYLNETGQSLPDEELEKINTVAPYATCPIVNISWNDAKNYCRWLRKVTGEYYNLPTSYEWEAAARGTYGLHYPWGEQSPTLEVALFNDGVNEPLSCSSVDYYANNCSPYGVVGMVGNAMEWTNDSFDDERDPHILKGGSWRSPIDFCNTHSSVVSYPPSRREDYFGFRVIHVPAEYFKDYYIANMT